MRRTQVDLPFGFGVDPRTEDATAREHETVCAGGVNHCQLKIAVEWGGGYWLPLHAT